MTGDDRELAALLRQDRLDRMVQITTELAERERARPGSVPDVAVEAMHFSVTSLVENVLRLNVRP